MTVPPQLSIWHLIGVFLPRYSPKERRKMQQARVKGDGDDEQGGEPSDWADVSVALRLGLLS